MCSPLTEWQRVRSMMCSCLGSRGPATLPSTVEARSWATSMNHLLQSSYGTALFRAFLQREYAEENLDFILQVETYWEATPKKRGKEAWRIYRTYICIGSPHELNLDMLSRKVRSAVARSLRFSVLQVTDLAMITPHVSTFDTAQRRVVNLLSNDAYPRFLRWSVYLRLAYPELYPDPADVK